MQSEEGNFYIGRLVKILATGEMLNSEVSLIAHKGATAFTLLSSNLRYLEFSTDKPQGIYYKALKVIQ